MQPGRRYEFSRDLLEDYGFLTKDPKYVTYSRFLLSVRPSVCPTEQGYTSAARESLDGWKAKKRRSEEADYRRHWLVHLRRTKSLQLEAERKKEDGRRPENRWIFDDGGWGMGGVGTEGSGEKRCSGDGLKQVNYQIQMTRRVHRKPWRLIYAIEISISLSESCRNQRWTCVFQSAYHTGQIIERTDVAIGTELRCDLRTGRSNNRKDRQWPMTRQETLETLHSQEGAAAELPLRCLGNGL